MKYLSQMTEEELKTIVKSLEAEYGENSTVTIKQSDFNNMWASIDNYAKENKKLNEQLKYALEVMGQIAKLSDNKTDAVQCANAICVINEWGKNE